ncbi:PREDICTED: cyclin-J18-like isoform X2 [Tarenaya hassleriana]|uniref:cyclin-J18-like isoform X2 n=1 Tax=Tarenaya hassleriana TaxID=28532 RepID=UPI00053CA4EC|nr:PREDICTED: cyclin-J18-like isoform X2 [Tarenaya hassleriana]
MASLRRTLVEFLIRSASHLEVPPIVKYSAFALFFDRFRPSLTRFLQIKKAKHWLLQPLTESNLQLFVLIAIWVSSKMHDSRASALQSFKNLSNKLITEQHFTVQDFLEAVLKFEIGTSNISYVILEDLYIQFKEVAKVGELLNFEACMDMMDLLYEKEEASILFGSSASLAASILVCSYIITVPKQRWEFPLLPWVKFVTSCNEGELVVLVRHVLNHVLGT